MPYPPESAIVLSVDEKSQCKTLEQALPVLPMHVGSLERQTHDYVRRGITSLFYGMKVTTWEVTVQCHSKHRNQKFLRFLKYLNSRYPDREG